MRELPSDAWAHKLNTTPTTENTTVGSHGQDY